MNTNAGSSRQRLDDLMQGYRAAQVIMTAERLQLFARLGTESKTLEDLVTATQASRRGLRMLCDALTALGFLEKSGASYANTALSREFLLPESETSQNALVRHGARLYERWGFLHDAVRSGRPVDDSKASLQLERNEADFARAMASSAATQAKETASRLDLSDAETLLDLGGGPGCYAIEFARQYPRLTAVVLDRDETLKIAQARIDLAGLSSRICVRAGDILESNWGGPYDVVFVSNVIHVFCAEDNERLARKAASHLTSNGRLCLKDFVVQPDHTGPEWACLFALNMLINTADGDCYSSDEIQQWFKAAKLDFEREIELNPPSRLLVARKKS
ncbi:MAG TPA: class I SAM-dependent methyltransferase [Candidatus Paceibacterota bacterium]|nr:class I SAM-dependent methyltransferase [Verrucomicrobiota bacterium]HRY46645.1 class I SAM-dependent methyltransferase [Candidatus Paceibacterota bacterium]HSA00949.1 class I SAM-dependent methyltransferase [Candidatus Paceibacterota bacterium]